MAHRLLCVSVCFWHTFRGKGQDIFGAPTFRRSWDDESNSLDNAFRRMRAAFELFQKLGIRFWTFHDRDIAPEGKDLAETNANLDKVIELALQLQKETGVKCLWGTANLFSHPRYANGAATNPDAQVFAYAACQVKKAMEVTHKLGGESQERRLKQTERRDRELSTRSLTGPLALSPVSCPLFL